jgi:phosphoglycolate phosphatase
MNGEYATLASGNLSEVLSPCLKCIIFDCDGVIILNTNEIYDEALFSTSFCYRPAIPLEEIKDIMSKTRGKTFIYQLELILGRKDPNLKAAIQNYENYIHSDEVYSRIKLLEGSSCILWGIKNSGYKLALATGMNPSLMQRLFMDGIIPNVFDQVSLVHDITNPMLQKPNPKILIDLASSLDISPEEAAYVGDTEDDIQMAKACNMFSIAVLTGRLNRSQALAKGANRVLPSILELPKCLGIKISNP